MTFKRYRPVMMLIALVTVFFQPFQQSASAGRPLFSVSPKQEVYSRGESINLTCSAVENHRMSRIQFTNSKWYLYFPTLPPSAGNFTHSLYLSPQDSGMFSCIYYVEEPGQEVIYLESNVIRISVLDALPPPKMNMDPPSRAVNEGDSLLITCSTERIHTEKKFHFYKNEVEMTSGHDDFPKLSRDLGNTSPEASISIPQAGPIHNGEFACRYEEKMSNGWTMSPWSQKMYLTVQTPKSCVPSPLLYVWMAVPLVIMIPMVPLAFYCGTKKSAPKCLEKVQPQEHREDDYLEYVPMGDLDCPFYRAQTSQQTSFLPLVSTQPKSTSRMENGPEVLVGEEEEEEENLYRNVPYQNNDRVPEIEILQRRMRL